MNKDRYFENYPFCIVFSSILVSAAIYLIGAVIIYMTGLAWLILYLIFLGILEFRLMKGHCVKCYYFGKTCAFGRGKLSSIFFKKGNSNEFNKMNMTWKSILPDFLVSLIPLVTGIVLLIEDFDWILLSMVVLLIILTFAGNAFVRSQRACKYCKQRQRGCPAQKLFDKRK